jgi:hypothetical protein
MRRKVQEASDRLVERSVGLCDMVVDMGQIGRAVRLDVKLGVGQVDFAARTSSRNRGPSNVGQSR